MNVLLVNDDGIHSEGILSLARKLKQDNRVTVIAPLEQRSAYSHAFTMHDEIIVYKADIAGLSDIDTYMISGTPADCVKLGIITLCKVTPDIVISGINFGANMGTDIAYSGTVSAAFEGAINGIKSIAVSQCTLESGEEVSFGAAVDFIAGFINTFDFSILKENSILNINIPDCDYSDIKGTQITVQGKTDYKEYYEIFERDCGSSAYVIKGTLQKEHEKGSDAYAVLNGYISITPLKFDKTDMQTYKRLCAIYKK